MLTRPWSTTSRSSSPSVPRTRPTSRATRRSTATGWVSRRGPGRSPDPFRGLRRTLQSRFANAPAFANRSADAELAHHPQADDLLLHVVLERHALGGAHHLLLEDADVLAVGVLQQPLVTVTSTDAGLLHAPGRSALGGIGRGQDVVDVPVAGLAAAPEPDRGVEVTAPHRGLAVGA